jgi:hypothetical protein
MRRRSESLKLVVMVPGEEGWSRGAHELQREAAEGLSWPGDEEPSPATKVLVGRRNGVRRGGFGSKNGCGSEWRGIGAFYRGREEGAAGEAAGGDGGGFSGFGRFRRGKESSRRFDGGKK